MVKCAPVAPDEAFDRDAQRRRAPQTLTFKFVGKRAGGSITELHGGFMSTPKEEVASMLESLPESSSYEDIQYHVYVLEKVNRGLERAATEGAIPHEEAKKRLGKWLSA